jgi:hypothetical protein
MVLIKRVVTCIYTYHEANSSLDHHYYKSQLIGGMLLHITLESLDLKVSMYFDSYPKMVNVMKLEWVVLNLSGLILK